MAPNWKDTLKVAMFGMWAATNPTIFGNRKIAGLLLIGLFAGVWGATSTQAYAVSCSAQGEISAPDREAITAAADPLAAAVFAQNFDLLHGSLLPAVVADWDGIRAVAQSAGPEVKGGTLHWRNTYLLDATDLKAPADTQFFCTNPDNSLTVTINLHSLPPGRYALLMADFPGAALEGQLAFILGFDGQWKLGGLFAREGALDGHDGIWYWTQARQQAKQTASWAAWFSYDVARWLLLPVDFISSPNLERLNQEQMRLKASPIDAMPMTVRGLDGGPDTGKSWKVTSLRLDTTLHTADLALTYEGAGLTEPQAARAEAIGVMSSMLKSHPELRTSFHGMWAYAEKDGKRTFAVELAMHDIP